MSIAEFETAMHTAVDGYLFACEQLGQAAEKPAGGRLMLRIDPAVHAGELDQSGDSHNRTPPLSSCVRYSLSSNSN